MAEASLALMSGPIQSKAEAPPPRAAWPRAASPAEASRPSAMPSRRRSTAPVERWAAVQAAVAAAAQAAAQAVASVQGQRTDHSGRRWEASILPALRSNVRLAASGSSLCPPMPRRRRQGCEAALGPPRRSGATRCLRQRAGRSRAARSPRRRLVRSSRLLVAHSVPRPLQVLRLSETQPKWCWCARLLRPPRYGLCCRPSRRLPPRDVAPPSARDW
mmetsp:Transcript_14043/g.46852  ORF Transcript_14043/g.46852 Transcript_14043/m.46852 type:complete len:217 (+) Transcript_14043:793-1443(+)